MSHERRLRAAAIEATQDESIIDVAEFAPKGSAAARGLGAAVGSIAGDAVGGDDGWGDALGKSVGALGGAVAGDAAASAARDLPARICVAASPTDVYLLAMPKIGVSHLAPFAKLSRTKLGVEVHQRASVRTVVLEDMETGIQFPMEAPRVNLYHAKAMVELLMLSGTHHDGESGGDPLDAADQNRPS